MDTYYWGLPGLATFIRWLEELIAILSKPFLMVGFIISMVDLLTQGRLLDIWLIYYGWAIIQAVAVDACFFVTWHKAKKAFISYHWFQFIGYALLGLALGIVAWAAMDLQSLEQAVGISNAEALARLNLNPVLLTHLRSLVAVIMGAIVAMISPEDSKNVQTKSDKKVPGFVGKIIAKLPKKKQPVQSVTPPQNEEKTAKNEQPVQQNVNTDRPTDASKVIAQSECFTWPESQENGYAHLKHYQDFTLIEHMIPVTMEPEGEAVEEMTRFTDELPDSEQEDEEQENTEETPAGNPTKFPKTVSTRKQSGNASRRVYKVLKGNPQATTTEIASKAKVSPGYASRLRTKFLSEQQISA